MQSVPRVTAYLLVFIDFGRLSGWGSLRCCFSSVSCRRWISDNQFRKQFPIRVAVQTHYYFQFLPLIGLTGLNKKNQNRVYKRLSEIGLHLFLLLVKIRKQYTRVQCRVCVFFVSSFILRFAYGHGRVHTGNICVFVCSGVGAVFHSETCSGS